MNIVKRYRTKKNLHDYLSSKKFIGFQRCYYNFDEGVRYYIGNHYDGRLSISTAFFVSKDIKQYYYNASWLTDFLWSKRKNVSYSGIEPLPYKVASDKDLSLEYMIEKLSSKDNIKKYLDRFSNKYQLKWSRWHNDDVETNRIIKKDNLFYLSITHKDAPREGVQCSIDYLVDYLFEQKNYVKHGHYEIIDFNFRTVEGYQKMLNLRTKESIKRWLIDDLQVGQKWTLTLKNLYNSITRWDDGWRLFLRGQGWNDIILFTLSELDDVASFLYSNRKAFQEGWGGSLPCNGNYTEAIKTLK